MAQSDEAAHWLMQHVTVPKIFVFERETILI